MANSNTSLQKIPPQHLEAERSVLAAILLDNDALTKVLEILKEEDFYQEAHRKIFHHILNLFEENEVIDPITLGDELSKKGDLEGIGGGEYLLALLESIPTTANVASHAKIVQEKALLRRMINVATRIVGEGYEETENVDRILDRAEQLIFEISEDKLRTSFFSLKDLVPDSFKMVEEIYERGGALGGLLTGFDKLDEMTLGLHKSDLIIIAARPSMGKTSLALNIALNVAIRGDKLPVAVFSLETSKEQLVLRMLCSEARVDSHRLRAGRLDESDWPKLTKASAHLAEAPVYIDDTPAISVLEMRAKARRLKKEHGLGLIMVDYLQLMQGRGRENRQQEISEISRSLKGLARELDVPLIALSQLSRAVENRPNKRPILSDLRESGAIEQDADLIAFIYRSELYKKDDDDSDVEEGIAEIIIGKQRNGPIGKVKLAFLKSFTRFENLAQSHSAPF